MSTQVASASRLVPITPSDTLDLVAGCSALWIGVAGNLAISASGDPNPALVANAIILKGVEPGVIPIKVRRVYATGTTATDIVALYI